MRSEKVWKTSKDKDPDSCLFQIVYFYKLSFHTFLKAKPSNELMYEESDDNSHKSTDQKEDNSLIVSLVLILEMLYALNRHYSGITLKFTHSSSRESITISPASNLSSTSDPLGIIDTTIPS